MNTSGTFKFKGHTFLATKPSFWSKYTLSFVEKRTHHLMTDSEVVTQLFRIDPRPGSVLINRSFSVELLEIQQRSDGLIPFSKDSKSIFVCFQLSGHLTIRKSDRSLPLLHNHFQLCTLAPGEYELQLAAGYHAALIIHLEPEWLEEWFSHLNLIRDIAEQFKSAETTFQSSVPCRMSPVIRKWLSSIYNCPDTDIIYIDGNLKLTLSRIITHYDKTIREGEAGLAEEVKLYIDQNFCDPDLKVEMLAERFCVTRQTLRNHFIKKYGVNVRAYYIGLRVKYVNELRQFNNSPLEDLYKNVGYSDVSSLRAAMKKHKSVTTGKENN